MAYKNRIAIFDLGGQYTHLIARKVNKLGADSYIVYDTINPEIRPDTRGIILSGGPNSVYDKDSPQVSPHVFKNGLPVLGICYGHQLMAQILGGKVIQGTVREYGAASLKIKNSGFLFEGIRASQKVWMSHGDSISKLPPGFKVLASTPGCRFAAIGDLTRGLFGVQFHPEVTHTTSGRKILKNFLFGICKCAAGRDNISEISILLNKIKSEAGKSRVFFLVSGGVDSTVAFTLCTKALGENRVQGLCIDTGLMRKNELADTKKAFNNIGLTNVDYLDESAAFLKALKGVHDPEEKRKIIGATFIKVQDSYMKKGGIAKSNWLLGQGTIYPDTIESGGTKHSSVIKTHHNRVSVIEGLKRAGRLLEPIADYYKDEVRILGRQLSLPREIVQKNPFPGPGLAIRCLTAKQSNRVLEELPLLDSHFPKRSFTVRALSLKSVGVQGDSRSENRVLVVDGNIPFNQLENISTSITNNALYVNRVTYLLGAKGILGNAHIIKCEITNDRLDLLREADFTVTRLIKRHRINKKIWQFPVILVPLQFVDGETVALRPVSSVNGMTAEYTKMPKKFTYELAEQLMTIPGIDAVLYDITNKPPATIEWE